jgi:vanadium chloroperoxidase
LAIVHLAMYEAFATASGNPAGLPHYLVPASQVALVGAATPSAAVAGAAHRALSVLYPRQQAFFDARLGAFAIPAGPANANGFAFGRAVADRLLQVRSSDPLVGNTPLPAAAPKPSHRSDPQSPLQPAHGALYGTLHPFASANNLALDPPPYGGGTDAKYLAALRQVKAKGIAAELSATVSSAARRTTDESMIGVYWGYDGAKNLGTPPRLYNQVIRELVATRVPALTVGQQARLFALVNAAMGDAGILCWREKYRHNFWRPVVGVREHDPSMGSGAVAGNPLSADCDSGWLPFGAPNSNRIGNNFTPPFPAYPSGHATFGAAAFGVARHYLERLQTGNPNALAANGADNFFSGGFVSDECNGVTTDSHGVVRPRHLRSFPGGLWQMIVENGRSRVFLGVHWIFDAFAVNAAGDPNLADNIGGVKLGLDIASSVITSGMVQQA